MDHKHAISFMSCTETGSKELFQHIPAEANIPIAVSPDNMNSMMHMGHATGTRGIQYFQISSCIPRIHNVI